MRTLTWLPLVLLPALAVGQSPEAILEKARQKQLERWEGVQSYSVTRSIAGSASTTVYRRSEVQTDAGTRTVFEPVSAGLNMTNGMPGGPFAAGASVSEADAMADFIEHAEFVGTETVADRKAFHLRSTDPARLGSQSGDDFELETADVWIDADEYVPLKMTMTGRMREGGRERPVSIERIQTDYRTVPGSKMYESYRQTMTMSGAMSDAERAELEQAKAELEKFEQEMAAMPAQQRAMVENMMGSRMDMMRDMINDSGITIDVVVSAIEVNPL